MRLTLVQKDSNSNKSSEIVKLRHGNMNEIRNSFHSICKYRCSKRLSRNVLANLSEIAFNWVIIQASV